MKKAVVLIGHGGVPRDFPADKVGRLRMLEAARQRAGTIMTDEEAMLDHEIRSWPRTPANDPFHFGILAIARSLEPKLKGAKLVIAYNEFCGPSIEDAVADLVEQEFQEITLLTTMFTPGGVHSEVEIPEIAHALQSQYPGVKITYPWPFDLNQVADLLAMQSGSSCTTQQTC